MEGVQDPFHYKGVSMYIPPSILIPFTITNISILARWTDYIPGDPYKNIAYRWTATLNITPQKHGDKFTPTPYTYNALDIEEGMWVSNKAGGYVYRIINIHDGATATSVVVDLEDVDRMNLTQDPSKTGISVAPSKSASGYIFTLDAMGMPILQGIPAGTISASFQPDLQSRFAFRNEMNQYIRVEQPGHSFVLGDIIRPDPNNVGKYILASTDNEITAIGTITDISKPSVDYFNYRPFGKIIYNINPPLTGNYGDIYYLDPKNPGKMTTTKPLNGIKPIYIQIDETTGIVLDDNSSEDPIKYHVKNITDGQVSFILPGGALEVLQMSINGVYTDNFIYDSNTLTLTFDPISNGYGIDSFDEVIITYKQ